MNDELQFTNVELRERTGEITALNAFMESFLGSLAASVVVVDRDLTIQTWNAQAADLWGLREDEAIGEHLLNLDSGLPADKLKPLIRDVVLAGAASREQTLTAVNRRGRSVRLRVRVTPLRSDDEHPAGALLLMEVEDDSAVEAS
jgi:two-component system CheB/CheR fusion protein